MNKTPEEYVVDIIKHELKIPDTYGTNRNNEIIPCIAIGSQDVSLGTTDKLQVLVWDVWSKITSNHREQREIGGEYFDIQQALYCDTIQVDFMSKNSDARNRRFELIPALKSTYTIQQSDANGFRIYEIPETLVNIGQVVGGGAINRWSLRFKMSYMYEKRTKIDYYDTFNFELLEDSSYYKDEINIK